MCGVGAGVGGRGRSLNLYHPHDVKIPTWDGDNNWSRTSETTQRKCVTSLEYHKPGAQDSHRNATTLLINTGL